MTKTKIPNVDILKIRLDQAMKQLKEARKSLEEGNYRSCGIEAGSAMMRLLEVAHFAYDAHCHVALEEARKGKKT